MNNTTDKKYMNKAIELAKNDFIFLSDQDDIWIHDRVKIMKKKLLS